MSIISYAQNFEDVMLWRALKDVEHGFYIDIGAQDPLIDSVSLAFYEKGWRGVHIEPTLQYSAKLQNARPDEAVEMVVVGKNKGQVIIFEFPDTGLSTIDFKIAKKHEDAGFKYNRRSVEVVTLDFLLEKYGGKDIHWLKIDVEGSEKAVLESWQSAAIRPWVIVIESTEPLSQIENYLDWEDLLIGKGYLFCYFDGVNRFYVHSEREILTRQLKAPPNIFDGFGISASHPCNQILAGQLQQSNAVAKTAESDVILALAKAEDAEARAQAAESSFREATLRAFEAETLAEEARSRARHAEVKRSELEQCLQQLESRVALKIQAIHSSFSWRLTAPMRWAARVALAPWQNMRLGLNFIIYHTMNSCSRPISKVIRLILIRPHLSRRINDTLLKKAPHLQRHLRSIAGLDEILPSMKEQVMAISKNVSKVTAEIELTQAAERVLADLKVAIEKKKRKL